MLKKNFILILLGILFGIIVATVGRLASSFIKIVKTVTETEGKMKEIRMMILFFAIIFLSGWIDRVEDRVEETE